MGTLSDGAKGVCRLTGGLVAMGLAAGVVNNSFIDGQWDNCDKIIQPEPENGAIYDKYYKIYRSLYEKTAGEMHLLE